MPHRKLNVSAQGFLESYAALLAARGRLVAREAGVAVTTTRTCGMFGLYFTDRQVETFDDAMASDAGAFKRFFHAMLKRGVYFAPSAFEAGFLSSAHGDIEIGHTLEAARDAFRELRG